MKLRNVISGLMTTALLFSSLAPAATPAPRKGEEHLGRVPRPPQFILLSFDGSKSIPFWQETRSFAKKYNIGFTYFISGVYFLAGADTKIYQSPGAAGPRDGITRQRPF